MGFPTEGYRLPLSSMLRGRLAIYRFAGRDFFAIAACPMLALAGA
jgi:hypothetical protein